ncbi:hypothetical protein E2C01_001999 [Portunus trituberculatus]|uniref:Uncharacterized protein n=1 Tax=Portunus trituberculatus TaxID=210409 RepID=A0A5B7CIL9_PORTR|nr:hypothetical protein [Portunus trituberculatus]
MDTFDLSFIHWLERGQDTPEDSVRASPGVRHPVLVVTGLILQRPELRRVLLLMLLVVIHVEGGGGIHGGGVWRDEGEWRTAAGGVVASAG